MITTRTTIVAFMTFAAAVRSGALSGAAVTLGRPTAHRPTHCPILILGEGSFQMPRVEEDEMFQAVRTSAASITVTNARQRNAMPADAFLAHDRAQAPW
jgi:hypothetical protein